MQYRFCLSELMVKIDKRWYFTASDALESVNENSICIPADAFATSTRNAVD